VLLLRNWHFNWRRTGRDWVKADLADYPLPRPLLERFEAADGLLRGLPPGALPSVHEWGYLGHVAMELARMLRQHLPGEFSVYLEEEGVVSRV
jgi:hypothetical protein